MVSKQMITGAACKSMLIKLSVYNSYWISADLIALKAKLFARANSARGEITYFEPMM